MKDVRDVRVSLAELAGRLGCEPDPAWLRYVIGRVGVTDVRIEGDALVHASFVPIEALLRESIAEMEASGVRPTACRACGAYHDAEHEDGIFEDPVAMDGFVCRPCAESMSAWTYFHHRLKI